MPAPHVHVREVWDFGDDDNSEAWARCAIDGLRDGEHLREWMTARFREELAASGRRWIVASGTHQNRMRTAMAAIDDLLHLSRRSEEP